MFEANSFKYDNNFDWIENRPIPSRKSSAFLHLVNRQQEIARRNGAKRIAQEEANAGIKNSRQLKPITPQMRRPSQNSNSLVVNYTFHLQEQPSGEMQDKSFGNLQGTGRSLKDNTPAVSSSKVPIKIKENTTKCCCLIF